ncbi:hypothetical protein E9229_003665 [Paeniglutamicibacter cryotolerans]|uniref:Uncharacterized protein n=1 Tax=Paeniglutamicibacter cryotolerans TaxID=670079 RepID=A0A839QLW3_9MICC|nr:hypothetical protein [Paeniglutamicibacter cryotolerans]
MLALVLDPALNGPPDAFQQLADGLAISPGMSSKAK